MHPPEHAPQRQADQAHRDEQMTLFTHGAHPRARRTRLSRNERMALRLEQLADEKICERLKLIWTDPASLDPARHSADVTGV